MTLTSPLFLFAFLPIIVILYSLLDRRWRNILIALASLGFYIFGDPAATLLLLILVLVNWGFGLGISRLKEAGRPARWLAAVAISLDLLALGYYKYAAFLVSILNVPLIFAGILPLPAPSMITVLGISFITFTAVSYIVDILRGDAVAYNNPTYTFSFIALFPKVIAGPITTFKSLAGQVLKREWSAGQALSGGARFILGLAKKVIIADTIGTAVNQIFSLPAGQLTPAVAWIGAIGYTLQLYFDFSGYSDMAIGLGRVFGFTFMENFNYPYISTSVREFWRRWHMSLTNWFREYLYIPLGGNRAGRLRTYGNLMTVFLLCGLWHGANWTFIVWGAWHGLFLILERLPLVNRLGKAVFGPGARNTFIFMPLKYVYTMLVVILGWVMFRSGSVTQALEFLRAMFGCGNAAALAMPVWYMSNSVVIAMLLAVILSWPLAPRLLAGFRGLTDTVKSRMADTAGDTLAVAVSVIILLALLLLSLMMLTSRNFQPFIYAQF